MYLRVWGEWSVNLCSLESGLFLVLLSSYSGTSWIHFMRKNTSFLRYILIIATGAQSQNMIIYRKNSAATFSLRKTIIISIWHVLYNWLNDCKTIHLWKCDNFASILVKTDGQFSWFHDCLVKNIKHVWRPTTWSFTEIFVCMLLVPKKNKYIISGADCDIIFSLGYFVWLCFGILCHI
jgi:hypothetical protein